MFVKPGMLSGMYTGYFLVYVIIVYVVITRGIASPVESFILECSPNKPVTLRSFTLVNWYRNDMHVASTERYTSGECGVINYIANIKYSVGRCDQYVHQLIINNVSYTEDNGAHWSCNDNTMHILSVVEPTSGTTASTEIIETTATTAAIETISSTATTQYTKPTVTTGTSTTAVTVSEHQKAKQVKSEPIVIIAGSVGATVLVIVATLVIICVIYKHRKKSIAIRDPIMTENDLHVSAGPGVDGADNVTGNQSQRQTKFPEYAKVSETNRPHQPTSETIIMENDLYTSADQPTTEPIIMENGLYTSADQCQTDCADIYIDQTGNAHFNSSVTTPGDTDGPVYSLVNKTKKPVLTPDNDGPVYSLVNKHKNPVPVHGDKDGPVYSIVNKHNN